jgi:hypothetical protein
LPELALIGLTTQESLFVQKLKSLLQQNRPMADIHCAMGSILFRPAISIELAFLVAEKLEKERALRPRKLNDVADSVKAAQ